jgi:broad specificity phosphatase PhoE
VNNTDVVFVIPPKRPQSAVFGAAAWAFLLYPGVPDPSPPEPPTGRLVIVRHGSTSWSKSGRHTGRTDVPLDDQGRHEARELAGRLSDGHFAQVFTSPLSRAAETCVLAGYGDRAVICSDLMEWDYGAYEGRTTMDIRAERPGWRLWTDGVVDGESVEELSLRADRVIERARCVFGDTLAFGHGHLLRALCARWVGLPGSEGARFMMNPSAIGVLSWERETPTILRWNDTTGYPLC